MLRFFYVLVRNKWKLEDRLQPLKTDKLEEENLKRNMEFD